MHTSIWVAIAAALICQSGCAGISHDRFSEPRIERSDVKIIREGGVGDMFEVGDVAFHVFPLNATGTDVMIFPVPHRFAEPSGMIRPFLVGVAFKAKTAGYSVIPSSIQYWSGLAVRTSPSRIQGPYACSSSKPRPPIETITDLAIPLAPRSCVYLWLYFDTNTPDPAQTFFIGPTVRFEGNDIALPVIQYQEAKRTHTFAMP